MATDFPASPSNGDTHAGFTFNSTTGAWESSAGGGGGSGVTSHANVAAFPASPSEGDLAYAQDTDALYLRRGSGWERIDNGGESPVILTEPPTTTQKFAIDGSTKVVTMTAQDPEGFGITYGIAYATANNARPTQLSADTTINQSTGVYTFTASNDSANAGSFKARLSASDGIQTSTRFVNFVLNFNVDIELLLVAGGGGGNDEAGGGGGAGGLIFNNAFTALGGTTYNIVVGTGGTASQVQGTRADPGVDSTWSQGSTLVYTATGGEGGGNYPHSGSGDGGSGAGAGRATGATDNGSSTQASYSGLGFGNDGGISTSAAGAGGGGGAGGVGANGQYYSNYAAGSGANGGAGKAISITGSSVYYAPGGPGAGHDVAVGNYVDGTANSYGAGGAGGQWNGLAPAYDGKEGVCIIAAPQAASAVTGTYTLDTSGRSGYHVYTFTGNGSITF